MKYTDLIPGKIYSYPNTWLIQIHSVDEEFIYSLGSLTMSGSSFNCNSHEKPGKWGKVKDCNYEFLDATPEQIFYFGECMQHKKWMPFDEDLVLKELFYEIY